MKKWGVQMEDREKESQVSQKKIMSDHKNQIGNKEKKMPSKTLRARLLGEIENMPSVPTFVPPTLQATDTAYAQFMKGNI